MTDVERSIIRQLAQNREAITRTVTEIENGVTTRVTTSDPQLLTLLRRHIQQMKSRLEEGRAVRLRDPDFRALFAQGDQIKTEIRDIENGLEIVQTTDSKDVVPVIRTHARKVTQFLRDGPGPCAW